MQSNSKPTESASIESKESKNSESKLIAENMNVTPQVTLKDGTVVTAVHADIKFWDATTGDLLKELHGHESTIHTLAMMNGFLVSGSYDGTIKYWNLETHECLHTYNLKSHIQDSFARNSNRFTRNKVDVAKQVFFNFHTFTVVSEDTLICASHSSGCREYSEMTSYNVTTGKAKEILHIQDDTFNVIILLSDEIVIGGTRNGNLIFFKKNGEPLQTINAHDDIISTLKILADGTLISSAYDEIKLWDLKKYTCLRTIKNDGFVADMQPLADGTIMVSTNNSVRFLNPETGKFSKTLASKNFSLEVSPPEEKKKELEKTSISPYLEGSNFTRVSLITKSKHKLVIVNKSGDISLWCLKTGKRVANLKNNQKRLRTYNDQNRTQFMGSTNAQVSAITTLQNGTLAIAYENQVRFWNPKTREYSRTILNTNTNIYALEVIVTHDDGELVVTGEKNQIRVWDPVIGICEKSFHASGDFLFSDGSHFVSAGNYRSKKSENNYSICESGNDELDIIEQNEGQVTSLARCGIYLADVRYSVVIYSTISKNSDGKDNCVLHFQRSGKKAIAVENLPVVHALLTLPNGILVSGHEDAVRFWDPSAGKCLKTLNEYNCMNATTSSNPRNSLMVYLGRDEDNKYKIAVVDKNNNLVVVPVPLDLSAMMIDERREIYEDPKDTVLVQTKPVSLPAESKTLPTAPSDQKTEFKMIDHATQIAVEDLKTRTTALENHITEIDSSISKNLRIDGNRLLEILRQEALSNLHNEITDNHNYFAYYSMGAILICGLRSACQSILSGYVPAAASAGSKAGQLISAFQSIPGVGIFASIIGGAVRAGSDIDRKQKIARLANFFIQLEKPDEFLLNFIRILTVARSKLINEKATQQQTGTLAKIKGKARDFKHWVTADGSNDPIKVQARNDIELLIKAILEGKITKATNEEMLTLYVVDKAQVAKILKDVDGRLSSSTDHLAHSPKKLSSTDSTVDDVSISDHKGDYKETAKEREQAQTINEQAQVIKSMKHDIDKLLQEFAAMRNIYETRFQSVFIEQDKLKRQLQELRDGNSVGNGTQLQLTRNHSGNGTPYTLERELEEMQGRLKIVEATVGVHNELLDLVTIKVDTVQQQRDRTSARALREINRLSAQQTATESKTSATEKEKSSKSIISL